MAKRNKKLPALFIDMDDTICDYQSQYDFYKETNPWIKYPQSLEGFFLELQPIPKAKEVINSLKTDFDIWFVTRPSSKNPLSYTEKRLWIEKYYGLEICEKLWYAPDKAMLIGKGNYLVDDKIWENFEGEQILFGSEKFKTWDDVYTYLQLKI